MKVEKKVISRTVLRGVPVKGVVFSEVLIPERQEGRERRVIDRVLIP